MIFTPEVIAAIETLRKNAENDFELHRISVLEKDLTAPPVVEVIDDKHQHFNGTTYRENKQNYYVGGASPLHRAVYRYYYGEIPRECDIHHRDLNPANNNISNLQLLTSSEHRNLHTQLAITYKKCPICGKIFRANHPKRDVYCSMRCFRQLQQKRKAQKFKNCVICGAVFYPAKPEQECCSKSCASKKISLTKRRLKAKVCPICGKTFEPKYLSRVKTCSRSCAMKLSWQKRKRASREKICPQCGKSFITYHKEQIFCSHSCAMKKRYSVKV